MTAPAPAKPEPTNPTDPNPAEPTEPSESNPAEPTEEVDWKAKARDWEKKSRDNAAQIKAMRPKVDEYERLVEAGKTELEKAQHAAQEAQSRASGLTSRAVRAEIRAGATGFIDVDVPFAYLDLTSYVGDDGEIDNAKITTDLADLLKRKPELAKPSGEPQRRVPAPNPAQGSSASGVADYQSQIAAAKKAGDWRTVLKLENQKLLDQPVQ